MIIYYAGAEGEKQSIEYGVKYGMKNVMLSYYSSPKIKKEKIDFFYSHNLGIMVDSGAFSAWKRNIFIDIDDYIEYIKKHNFKNYINLDVVGNPDKSLENLIYMKKYNLNPIPVFHFGSNKKYLENLISIGYSYIALGGTVGLNSKIKENFFDEIFFDFPNIKFHGLGMTSIGLIRKYSWFSVDSTTWLIGRKFLEIQTDHGRIKIDREAPMEQKIGLNVLFFSNLCNETQNKTEIL